MIKPTGRTKLALARFQVVGALKLPGTQGIGRGLQLEGLLNCFRGVVESEGGGREGKRKGGKEGG